jgi:hypothetical protein
MSLSDCLLRVSSSERSAGSTSSSDFSVSYPNNGTLAKVVSIVVKHVSFPNVFYNINTTNNEFIFRMAGGSGQSIIVPEGQYAVSELIAYLNTELTGVGILTQNSTTSKLTIVASGYPFDLVESSMLKVLGFKPSSGNPSSHTAPNVPQLQGVQHVFINSKVLSKAINFIDANEKQERSIVIMIPNDVPWGSVKHYETVHDDLDVINFPSETSLQELDIKLVDADGNVLDLQGQELSLILKVYYMI